MEVTALCIRLFLSVFLLQLLVQLSYTEEDNAALLQMKPNKLQFFEYDSISFRCEASHSPTEWRVMRNISSDVPQWETSAGSLYVSPAFIRHSGEYWCENGAGDRSNTVNITVTDGDVILESPALPVMEQQTATLRCRKRASSSDSTADFFKDGQISKEGYSSEMIIHNVSKCDEGLYKCRMSGSGESAESWLAVRGRPADVGPVSVSSGHSCHMYLVLRTVFTVVMVALLLLLVGLLHCGKLRAA